MLAVCKRRCWVLLGVLLLCEGAWAQGEVLATMPDVPASVDAVLHGMVGRAGVIFVGTVLAVRRRAARDGGVGSGVVEVEFEVDQGLRGAATGSHYVLREWGGLWEGNEERYRTGDRRLMLLHAPGAGGLSSPVGGMDGAIPIRPGANAAAGPLVDLRWVAARASRGPVTYRADTPRIPRARPLAEVLHLPGEVTRVESVRAASAGIDTASVSDGDGVRSEQHSVAAQCATVQSVAEAIARWSTEPR